MTIDEAFDTIKQYISDIQDQKQIESDRVLTKAEAISHIGSITEGQFNKLVRDGLIRPLALDGYPRYSKVQLNEAMEFLRR